MKISTITDSSTAYQNRVLMRFDAMSSVMNVELSRFYHGRFPIFRLVLETGIGAEKVWPKNSFCGGLRDNDLLPFCRLSREK